VEGGRKAEDRGGHVKKESQFAIKWIQGDEKKKTDFGGISVSRAGGNGRKEGGGKNKKRM